MDYSAANTALWNFIIQLGIIAGFVLIANFLRRNLSFIRKSLMPVSVLAGFLLLIVRVTGLITLDESLMEMLVYHGIALGFISMSLRVPEGSKKDSDFTGLKSGAIIVSTYLIQGITGLVISLALAYTLVPGLFKAAGLLLPMGYGQGPGQANNIGSSYEAIGFAGGRSFGLAIAAAGYLVACIAGVIILNYLSRKGKINAVKSEGEEMPGAHFFQSKDEIPVSDSIDKLSVQLAMVLVVYLVTYFAAFCITSSIAAAAPGLAGTVNTLIWGFNFIFGSAIAMLLCFLLERGRKSGVIKRQYQNNYLLNRISGFFFDIMIVAGIASIRLEDVRAHLLLFVLMVAAGAIITLLHLRFVCRIVYRDYYYEGFISMFGMLTGTISSGVLLLREIDPDLATPASGNLITGSSFGIILGAPILVLVGLAPKSDLLCFVTLGIAFLYLILLDFLILKVHRRKKPVAGSDSRT